MIDAVQYSLPSGTILQGTNYKYRIDGCLGSGAFGITYLATTEIRGPLGKIPVQVAIKEFFSRELSLRGEDGVVKETSSDRLARRYAQSFQKESLNLSRLHHPGIVSVLEAFEANGTYYYSMEYITGGSLDNHIFSYGPMKEDEAIAMIRRIGEALSFMHDSKMLHLDLKPKNIVLRPDGNPVIIDFGLSKLYSGNGAAETSTTLGMGTPGYAPMEQSQAGTGRLFTPTLDVYALGATLYKMLVGVTPPTASEVFNDGLPISELQRRGVSNSTISAIELAMQPRPKKRPQTVKALLSLFDLHDDKKCSIPQKQIGLTWSNSSVNRLIAIDVNCFCSRAVELTKEKEVKTLSTFNLEFNTDGRLYNPASPSILKKVIHYHVSENRSRFVDNCDIIYIVPNFFSYKEILLLCDISREVGIKTFRIMYEDYALAMDYIMISGTVTKSERKLHIRVYRGQACSYFLYEGGVLDCVDFSYSTDSKTVVNQPFDVVLSTERNDISILRGALLYFDSLRYGNNSPLVLERVRGGDLKVKVGNGFEIIIKDGTTFPTKRTIRFEGKDVWNFALYQGDNNYIGQLLLPLDEVPHGCSVELTVEIDHVRNIRVEAAFLNVAEQHLRQWDCYINHFADREDRTGGYPKRISNNEDDSDRTELYGEIIRRDTSKVAIHYCGCFGRLGYQTMINSIEVFHDINQEITQLPTPMNEEKYQFFLSSLSALIKKRPRPVPFDEGDFSEAPESLDIYLYDSTGNVYKRFWMKGLGRWYGGNIYGDSSLEKELTRIIPGQEEFLNRKRRKLFRYSSDDITI